MKTKNLNSDQADVMGCKKGAAVRFETLTIKTINKMETLLRQVKTETRTPKESGSYPTFIGNKWFNVKTGLWTEFCPSEVDDNQTPIALVYWLEVVELPSNEQIEKSIQSEKSGGHEKTMSQNYIDSKIDGAKWMLDVLAGKAVTPKIIA
jgi:hypothetical protein